jgi:uncharacterized protein (DUF1684 family)
VKRSAALLVFLAACSKTEQPAPPPAPAPVPAVFSAADHAKEITAWQQDRDKRLRTEEGWLTLVGLHWLKPGDNTFGSAKSNRIVMPAKAPGSMGTLTLAEGKVTLKPAAKGNLMIDGKPVTAPVELLDDTAEKGPTKVKAGALLFYSIKRSDRYGIRVKDTESDARKNFKGMEYFPTDPKWRVEARLEPYQPPKQIPITDITGVTSNNPSPGALIFDIGGKTYRLDPIIEEGSTDYFIIFKDETSKDATYGAGRYLYASAPGPDGKVIVDFNKAYNPPCVFTPYATCPLPPQQNKLPFRIEAGEKKYAGH